MTKRANDKPFKHKKKPLENKKLQVSIKQREHKKGESKETKR